jgi:uncharacterized membrane protein YgdD (TMEM256/DUF423 family)
MTANVAAFLGAINALVAVAAGAFGAHGLKSRVAPELLVTFETGARYHMYHALGLFAVAWVIVRGGAAARSAGWLMLAGIVLFSGSLYALALTGVRALGAITPIGGLCFLASWALLAWAALRSAPL